MRRAWYHLWRFYLSISVWRKSRVVMICSAALVCFYLVISFNCPQSRAISHSSQLHFLRLNSALGQLDLWTCGRLSSMMNSWSMCAKTKMSNMPICYLASYKSQTNSRTICIAVWQTTNARKTCNSLWDLYQVQPISRWSFATDIDAMYCTVQWGECCSLTQEVQECMSYLP